MFPSTLISPVPATSGPVASVTPPEILVGLAQLLAFSTANLILRRRTSVVTTSDPGGKVNSPRA